MSEFALHTCSSKVYITYPKLLETVDVLNAAYHIYMIHKIKRLSFVENSIKMFDTYMEVQIQHGVTKIETINIPLRKKFNFVDYGFEGDKILLMKDGYGGGIKADILWLYRLSSLKLLE